VGRYEERRIAKTCSRRWLDVLLTVDSNMEFQQNTDNLPVAVVVLVARSNSIIELLPLMPELRELLPNIEPGRLYRIGPAA